MERQRSRTEIKAAFGGSEGTKDVGPRGDEQTVRLASKVFL